MRTESPREPVLAHLSEGWTSSCPYCGEEVELELDPLGPHHEEYVEDCPVCCRPWTVRVARTDDGANVELIRDDA